VVLESATPEPQIIVGTPDARDLVTYEAPASLDRLGRRASAIITARDPGVFWLVTTNGIERLADDPSP
jgi:hypothetical protein